MFDIPSVINSKWNMISAQFSIFLPAVVLVITLTDVCNGYRIRKCCKDGQQFVNKSCEDYTNDLFHPLMMSVYKLEDNLTQINISHNHFEIVFGDPCGERGKYLLDLNLSNEDYLLENGQLYTPKQNSYYSILEYCLEAIDNSLFAFVCFSEEQPTPFRWYPVGMIISLPCLLGTILVYTILPELRRTLHGKCLICYAAMLFTGYLFLAVVQIKDSSIDKLDTEYCIFSAFVMQFAFLASFFWLNVMCFDIWWVFSGLRPLRGSGKEREHKKFIIYSAYAWGSPFIILSVSMVMQFCDFVPDNYIKPRFGVEKCWFKDRDATILYFYVPIGILVLLNIIMFVTTAYQLETQTKETRVLKRGESKLHNDNERQRYNIYLKLFIVMGINWVMELVSFFLQELENEILVLRYTWFVTDVCNTLQGVLIFLIFVWKRRTLRLLNHKLCPKLQLVPVTSMASRSKISLSRTTTTISHEISSNN